MSVDLLAIVAHPDDAELLCGGTLARAADHGHRTGILDLTRGELGSRGSPELRAREAAAAADVLGVSERANAGLPDGHLHNTDASRVVIVDQLRRLRPRTVIIPYVVGRHPDHRIASELVRDACFLSGLKNYPAAGDPHRPQKVCYALSFREDAVKPTFVVDISAQFERKLRAVMSYASQFDGATQGGELYPTGQSFPDLIATQNAHYGSLIRVRYGEPFWTQETMGVDDILSVGGFS
ncbi:MAG TPA: bacillithiol biosynthesis deacetylase BshB1 [Gemmatimonadales bacterium]